MATALLDLRVTSTIHEPISAWASAGLTREFAWAVPIPGTDDVKWSRPDRPDNTMIRNELLNSMADPTTVRLGIIVECDVADTWSRRFILFRNLLKDLVEDQFDVETTVLIVPSPGGQGEDGEEGHGAAVKRVISLAFLAEGELVKRVFVLSPEDSPRPTLSDELDGHSFDAVVAHTALTLLDRWVGDVSFSAWPPQTGGASFRLIRCWSQVTDLGFLADHVGRAIPLVDVGFYAPSAMRVSQSERDLFALAPVLMDFEVAQPTFVRKPTPEGFAYILAFLRFALPALPRHFVRLLWTWLLTPVIALKERLVARGLKRLGAPNQADPADGLAEKGTIDLLDSQTAEVRRVMQVVDSGAYPGDPQPAADVWRTITSHIVDAVDSQKLSPAEAVGPVVDPLVLSLIARYRQRLDKEVLAAGNQLRYLLDAPVDDQDPLSDSPLSPKPRQRRHLRRWLVVAIVFVVAMALLGLLLPALAIVVVVAIALFATVLITAVGTCVTHLALKFRREFLASDPKGERIELLRFWLAQAVRFAQRRSQTDRWTRVLRAMFAEAGQGPPIVSRDRGAFRPGIAPRAMQIGTGLVTGDVIDEEAKGVLRASVGPPYFRSIWDRLCGVHPLAFDDAADIGANGPFARLELIGKVGLGEDVIEVARDLIVQHLHCRSAEMLVDAIIPWRRQSDRNGLEMIEPAEGVVSLGPVDRTVEAGSELDVVASLVEFERTVLAVTDDAGHLLGHGVHIGDLVVTAALLCGEQTSVRVNDRPISFAPLGEFAVAVWEDSEDGHRLAGLIGQEQGRAVLIASEGSGAPKVATIEQALDDGHLWLDRPAILGSAVVDVETNAVVALVVGTDGRRAAGVTLLRRAVMEAAIDHRVAGDYDSGLRIPADVLMTSGVKDRTPNTRPGQPQTSTEPAVWFAPFTSTQPSRFRKFEFHGQWPRIDGENSHASPPLLQVMSSGRFLVVQRLVQVSEPFDLDVLPFVRHIEAQEMADGSTIDDPHGPNVGPEG